MNHEALRNRIKELYNGEYATSICPSCESFFTHPYRGDTDTAAIELCYTCKTDKHCAKGNM